MSSEMLLGQNVALIYQFIKEAVAHDEAGRHWQALKMLRTAAAFVYKDEKKGGSLDAAAEDMERIQNEAQQITGPSEETRRERQIEHLEREAAKVLLPRFEGLRDYMQAAGYYTMMNKSWDNRIVEMQEVAPLKARPERKIIMPELSNDVITAK